MIARLEVPGAGKVNDAVSGGCTAEGKIIIPDFAGGSQKRDCQSIADGKPEFKGTRFPYRTRVKPERFVEDRLSIFPSGKFDHSRFFFISRPVIPFQKISARYSGNLLIVPGFCSFGCADKSTFCSVDPVGGKTPFADGIGAVPCPFLFAGFKRGIFQQIFRCGKNRNGCQQEKENRFHRLAFPSRV